MVRLRSLVLIVCLPLVLYPLVSLRSGTPSLVSADDCVVVAAPDEERELELVYGHLDSHMTADELRDRVVSVGFVGTEVRPDGCGRWKVTYDGIDSYEQGQGTIDEARRAGFDPRLEVDPGS